MSPADLPHDRIQKFNDIAVALRHCAVLKRAYRDDEPAWFSLDCFEVSLRRALLHAAPALVGRQGV